MPLSYRQVKDLYDNLRDAGMVTQTLPQWSAEMNQFTESNLYGAGLHDNWIKRANVGIDRALEATGAPEVTGRVGEAIGGLFGAPEVGRQAGETIPRMGVDIASFFIPGLGEAMAFPRLAISGLMSGSNAYTQTDSVGAGVAAAALNMILPGATKMAEQAVLKRLGAERIVGEAVDRAAYIGGTKVLDPIATTTKTVNTYMPKNLFQGAAAYTAGQAAGVGLMGASDLAQQALDPNAEFANPFTKDFWLSQGIQQIPFAALHLAGKARGPGYEKAITMEQARVAEGQQIVEARQRITQAQERQKASYEVNPEDVKPPNPMAAALERRIMGEATVEEQNAARSLIQEAEALMDPSVAPNPERLQEIDRTLEQMPIGVGRWSKENPAPHTFVEGTIDHVTKNGKVYADITNPNGTTERIAFPTTFMPGEYVKGQTGKFAIPASPDYVERNVQQDPEYVARKRADEYKEAAKKTQEALQQELALPPGERNQKNIDDFQRESERLQAVAFNEYVKARQIRLVKAGKQVDRLVKIAENEKYGESLRASALNKLEAIQKEHNLPLSPKTERNVSKIAKEIQRQLLAKSKAEEAFAKRQKTWGAAKEGSIARLDNEKTAEKLQAEATRVAPEAAPAVDEPLAASLTEKALQMADADGKVENAFSMWASEKENLQNLDEEALHGEFEKEFARAMQYWKVSRRAEPLVNPRAKKLSEKEVTDLSREFDETPDMSLRDFPDREHVKQIVNWMDERARGMAGDFVPEVRGIPAGNGFVWSVNADVTPPKLAKDGVVDEAWFQKNAGIGGDKTVSPVEITVMKGLYPEAFVNGRVDMQKLKEALNDPERQPVTRVTYGMEGKVSEAKAEYDRMTHDWFDTLSSTQKHTLEDVFNGGRTLTKWLEQQGQHPYDSELAKTARKYYDLKAQASVSYAEGPRATSYYRSISPFDTEKYPVVRVDVVLPPRVSGHTRESLSKLTPEQIKEEAKKTSDKILWSPDNIHENLPNTLGWAMVQFVPDPRTGETVMFVGEQQSRWGQERQKLEARNKAKDKTDPNNEWGRELAGGTPSHPLLPLQHVLVLKAAIAEAQKRGVTKMVVSDGETAMMTEGHDKQAISSFTLPASEQNMRLAKEWLVGTPEARQKIAYNVGGLAVEHVRSLAQGKSVEISDVDFGDGDARPAVDLMTRYGWESKRGEPSQSGGMRLHYDTTLQSAMRSLTGDKGEKVEMGVHKNAVQNIGGQPGESVNDVMRRANETPSGSPVFRNPDGTPKSSATGTAYRLDSAFTKMESQGGFTLSRPSYAPGDAQAVVPPPSPVERQVIDAYKLNGNVFDMVKAVSEIAIQPKFRAAASWLLEKAPDLLRRATTKVADFGGTFALADDVLLRPSMQLSRDRRAFRELNDPDPLVRSAALRTLEHDMIHEALHVATVSALARPENAHIAKQIDAIRQDVIREAGKASPKLKAELEFIKDMSSQEAAREVSAGTVSMLAYSLKNNKEFVAFGNSPTKTQGWVQALGAKGKVMYGKLIAKVKQLLGIGPKETRLDELLYHTDVLMERENALVQAQDYIERWAEGKGYEGEVAKRMGFRVRDFLSQHGTEPRTADEMMDWFPKAVSSEYSTPALQNAKKAAVEAMRPGTDTADVTQMALGGKTPSVMELNNYLHEGLRGGDLSELPYFPPAVKAYLVEQVKYMKDITDGAASVIKPENRRVLGVNDPTNVQKTIKELNVRFAPILAMERARVKATEQLARLVDFAPDNAMRLLSEEGVDFMPEVKKEDVVDPPMKGWEKALSTINQLAARGGVWAEWLTNIWAGKSLAGRAATLSHEVLGMEKQADGTMKYNTALAEQRLTWLTKKVGNVLPNLRALDAWIALNNAEGKDKVTILSRFDPGVEKILSTLSKEDAGKVEEMIGLISQGKKIQDAHTVTRMVDEAAQNIARVSMLQDKDTLQHPEAVKVGLGLMEAAMALKVDPTDKEALQKLEYGRAKLTEEAYQYAIKIADTKSDQVIRVRDHMAANPGWVTAKRTKAFLYQGWDGKQKVLLSADNKKEAEAYAKSHGVTPDWKTWKKNEREEFAGMGPQNAEIEKFLMEKDAVLYDIMSKFALMPEELEALRTQATGLQFARATAQSYDVGGAQTRRGLSKGAEYLPWTRNYFTWINGNASYWHKRGLRAQLDTMLASPELRNDKETAKMMKDHMTGFLSPDPELAATVQRAVSVWNLGYGVASAAMNLTQPLFRGIPELIRAGVGWKDATKIVYQTMKDWGSHKWLGKDFTQEEQRFVKNLADDGITDATVFDEELLKKGNQQQNVIRMLDGEAPHTLGKFLTRAGGMYAHGSMGMFRMGEQANNTVMSLAAFRALRKVNPKMGYAELEQKARLMNFAVNDVGGRLNRPIGPFSAKEKFPRSIAMMMLSLQNFTLGNLNQLLRYSKDAWQSKTLTSAEKYAARKAFVTQLGLQVAAAGVLGLPFAGSMMALINQFAPDLEVTKNVRELMAKMFGEDEEDGGSLTNIAMTGLPSMLGWDVQSRLSSGNILPGVSEWNGFQPEQLLGVPGNNLVQLAKGAKQVVGGDVAGANAFLPPAFRKMAELIASEVKHGNVSVRDYRGRPVLNDLTLGETAGMVAGFNPKRLTDFNAAQRMAKQSEDVDNVRKARFRQQMAEEVVQGNFGNVVGQLRSMTEADNTFDWRNEVRQIAAAAESQVFPRDLRRESNGRERAKLLKLWNLSPTMPTEEARVAFRQKVERQFGLQPQQTSVREARLMDALRVQNPDATRSELRRMVQQAVHGVRQQTLPSLLE